MSNENKRIDVTQFEQDHEDLEGEIYFLLKYADPYKPKVSNALRHLPKLITELKRCYEEIDRVRSIAEDLHAYIVSDADISLSIAEKQMDWDTPPEWGY